MIVQLGAFIVVENMENTIIVERVYLDDKQIRPQTIAHHLARYEFARSAVTGGNKGLDLACGSGYGTQMLSEYDYKMKGVDISKEAIEYAQSHYVGPSFACQDICKVKADKYDLITFFEAIEHLPFNAGVKLLKKISKMLLPNGVFIMSTPRKNNGKYNTFHKSEWSYDLIKNTLGSMFSSVTIWGQDWDTAVIDLDHVVDNDFYVVVCKNDKEN